MLEGNDEGSLDGLIDGESVLGSTWTKYFATSDKTLLMDLAPSALSLIPTGFPLNKISGLLKRCMRGQPL
jgi:hypothetical protein